jgi:hypothetical protein
LRLLKLALMSVLVLPPVASHAQSAEGGGDPYSGTKAQLSKSGAHIELIDASTLAQWGSELATVGGEGPFFEYASVSPCGGLPGRPGSDELCARALAICLNDAGDGPAVAVFRREVDAAGDAVAGVGEWEARGITCFPELVPGADSALTMAMIREAFHNTDFAVPSVNIQPEGDVTLVNLPTYFEVQFPDEGYGPDEIDTPDPATLLGHHIEIRPRLKSVTYHLGEMTIGPTTDLGGPYPDGGVVATYTRPGTFEVRVDIVYTGQFRVAGSEWFDIPGDVDLPGATVTLDVREARARLYSG